jgi:hypothetical protein
LFALFGLGLTAWMWIDACLTGIIHFKGAFLFPAFMTIGLLLVTFPNSSFENSEAYAGYSGWDAIQRMPGEWRIGMIGCILVGAINALAMHVVLKYIVFAGN